MDTTDDNFVRHFLHFLTNDKNRGNPKAVGRKLGNFRLSLLGAIKRLRKFDRSKQLAHS